MAAAQILNLTHAVDNKVTVVGNKLKDVDDKMDVVISGRPGILATDLPNPDLRVIVARWKGRKIGSR